MKGFKIITVVLLIMVLCIGVSHAQRFDRFVLNGSGARAAGMGNAFTGVADDATAISWNVAGLTQLYSMEASVVGRVGFGTLGTDYNFADVEVERSSKFQINFASFIVPFKAGDYNVVGGIALRRLYDFTEELTFTASNEFGESEFVDDYSGGINAITPAIAVQFSEMLSFGAGINILTGTLEYEGTSDSGFDPDPWSVDYSGTSFDLGILVKPNQQLSLGANLNLPYTLKWEESEDGFTYETEMDVPFFFTVGAGYRATDKLLLAVDFASRSWSKAEISIDGGEPQALEDEVEDSNSLHFGLEYLAESGDSFLPLRLGFFTQPTMGLDSNDEQIVLNGITAGAGLIMESLILDGSFEYVFGTYIGDQEEGDFSDFRDVEYTQNDFRITVGATLHLGKK